ncbi:hypothetical protein ILYODFUR_019178, partial [Ilyodon furcidens]
MFASQGIQPVRVVFNNAKNCFLHLPSKLISNLSLQENQALELSWGNGSPVFLSWTQYRASSGPDGHNVELCRQLGEKLGLKDGEQGFLRPCHQVSSLNQVFVEPLSSDDWEILELHSSALEQQLLDQIRVVFQPAVFPVWVDNHTVIYIRIASVSPFAPYGRLEQFTELVVSPKIRPGIGDHSDAIARSRLDQQFHSQPDMGLSPPSEPSSDNASCTARSQQWGGVTGLLRHIIRGPHNPVKEQPPVPSIPVIFPDSIYRVLSPKEAKDKAKQAMEKMKNVRLDKDKGVKGGEEAKEEKATVVRVVCHDAEMLERGHNKGEIHSGKVWIPQSLASKLNIQPHSSVRIKPVKSVIKVAFNIHLQPLVPLPEEDDEEIQTAFLGWLHTKSHEPLACLTPRSSTIILHGSDAKLELSLTVLKPEPENDPPDQMFLLAPTVLQKEDIQVDRQTIAQSALKAETEAHETELPSLQILGGIDDLIKSGFEFISHNLLGSPLSRELCTSGEGLKGGALLITGAK